MKPTHPSSSLEEQVLKIQARIAKAKRRISAHKPNSGSESEADRIVRLEGVLAGIAAAIKSESDLAKTAQVVAETTQTLTIESDVAPEADQ